MGSPDAVTGFCNGGPFCNASAAVCAGAPNAFTKFTASHQRARTPVIRCWIAKPPDQSKSMTCPLRMLCHVPKHPRHPFDVCLAVAVAAVAHAAGSSAAEHRHRQRLGACPSCNATRSPPTRPPARSIFAFGRSQPGRGAPPSSRGSATTGSCPTQRWFRFRPPSVHSICRPNGPNRDRFPAGAIAPTPAPIGLIPCIRPPTGQAIARPNRAAFGWVG